MSDAKAIAQVLIDTLFSQAVRCGPGQNELAYFNKVLNSPSPDLKELLHLVPDFCYHPKCLVVFDFTYQFTSDFTSATGASARRPISEDTLYRVGVEFSRYFDYYFDYVLTYGNQSKKSQMGKLVDWTSVITESDLSLFINVFLNFYLSSFTVDSVVNSVGSATLHYADNYNYKDNKRMRLLLDNGFNILNQLFVPMVPVMIWAQGRLYKDWYFPVFDGYVISPESSNDAGSATITLTCRDSLELARVSTEMINPAILQVEEAATKSNIVIFNEPFYGLDHMKIFKTMFVGGQLAYDFGTQRFDLVDASAVNPNVPNFEALGNFEQYSDIDVVHPPSEIAETRIAIHKDQFTLRRAMHECSHEKRSRALVTWGSTITPYRKFATSSPNVFTSEFSSRLDVIQNIASLVYYNFYVDGYGNIHYHPMRLVNDYLINDIIDVPATYGSARLQVEKHKMIFPGVQVVGPEECFSASSRVNVEELVTFLRLAGMFPYTGEAAPEPLDLVGSARDTDLMSRFGYRRKSISNPLFNYNPALPGKNGKSAKFLDIAAKSLMQYMNAELYTTQRQLAFRPEFRMAMPVYFPEERDVFFCQSVSHSFTVNGMASTSINCNFGRKDGELPADLLSYMLVAERLYATSGKVPEISRYASEAEVKRYYEMNFNLENVPFLDWIDDLDKQRKQFEEYQKQKSAARSNSDLTGFED